MLVPTTRFYWLVALGILLSCVGYFRPGLENLVYAYDAALVILFFWSGLIARRWDGLTVRRQTENILSVRATNRVKLTLESDSPYKLDVVVRDEVPFGCDFSQNEFRVSVVDERPAEMEYTITPRDRGEHGFRGTFIRYQDPLGLAWIQKALPNQAPARVYPNVQAVKEFDLLLQRGHLSLMGVRKTRFRGLGMEFESLREYNDDDYRVIDWKASARRGKLVVRNYETEKNQGVIVCIDVGRHMLSEVEGVTKLDHVLDASLMLMQAALRQGDQIGLLVFNDEVKRYVPPKRGSAHVAAIVDALFDAQAEPVQSNYLAAFSYLSSRWKRRSLVVVFSDAENEDQAGDLASSLAHIRKNHKLIVVRVADPRLREMKIRSLKAPRDMHARAAAMWYLGDRRKAAALMQGAHIQSLESEPQDLAADLVGAYLKVKALAQV